MKRYEKTVNPCMVKKKSISLTAYRAFFIAKLLEKTPQSFEDLILACQKDPILNEKLHKDSITNSINSLRAAGFVIEKPKPSNNFRFTLISHPFKINLSKVQCDILYTIRNTLYHRNDYNIILKLNSAYDKLYSLIQNQDSIEKIEYSNYLKKIDTTILEKILDACKKKSTIEIVYDSPIHGKENLQVKAEKVVFENNRLYLWLYCYKYKTAAFFRIDKISETRHITDKQENISLTNDVEYLLYGNAAKKFIPNQNEIVVEKLSDRIKVRATVINKFNFFQRVLAFSEDCVILSPEKIKQEFLLHLEKIIEVNNAKTN